MSAAQLRLRGRPLGQRVGSGYHVLRGFVRREMAMVITLGPELESALNQQARQQGVAVEVLALDALRERFLVPAPSVQPQDEWERRLLGLAKNCGVSLSDAALSREALYE